MTQHPKQSNQLPPSLRDYIKSLINQMPYREKVCQEIKNKLNDHFTNALCDCKTDEEKNARAQTLIQQSVDPKFMEQLMRRAKKRSRPIWKKTLIRTAQATVALLLFFGFYTWWFVTGKPNITIDYVAKLNQMARPDAPDEQNAWPHYKKAIDQYAEPNETLFEMLVSIRYNKKKHASFALIPLPEQKAMRDWLAHNNSAWSEFLAAAEMTHCWFTYQTAPDLLSGLSEIRGPNLGRLKGLCRLGIWKARLHIERGDIHNALDHCLAILRTGRHLQIAPHIIDQIVGISISNMCYSEILHILSNAKLTDSQLVHLQDQFITIYQDRDPMINFTSERLRGLDLVQRYFTNSGPGGGHLLPRAQELTGWWSFNVDNVEGPTFTLISMIHAGRHDTLNALNTAWDIAERQAHLTPWQRHHSTDPTANDYINSLSKYRYYFVHTVFYSFVRATEFAHRRKARHEATLTILALKRWFLQKGSFPDSLEELIDAGLLRTLPLDLYWDGSLTYKKQGDDFILYSYAGDFDDDNGIQNPDNPWAGKYDSGDHVYWPLSN